MRTGRKIPWRAELSTQNCPSSRGSPPRGHGDTELCKSPSWVFGVGLQEVLTSETNKKQIYPCNFECPPLNPQCSTEAKLTPVPLKSPGFQAGSLSSCENGDLWLFSVVMARWVGKEAPSHCLGPVICCFLPELLSEVFIYCSGVIMEDQERLLIFPAEERLKE